MKKYMNTLKWISSQLRPFLFSFIAIIITGSLLALIGVSMAIASKNLVDSTVELDKHRIFISTVVFAAAILAQVVLRFIFTVKSSKLNEKISNNIRKRTFYHILQSKWSDYSKYHSEDILTRMTSDIRILSNVLVNSIPDVISLCIGILAAFITLFSYEPILATLSCIFVPTAFLLTGFLSKKLNHLHIKIQESEGKYRAYIHESILNLSTLKSFCIEERRLDNLNLLQNNTLDLVSRKSFTNASANLIVSIGYWLGYFIAFGFGALRLSEGSISFGTFIAFLQLVGSIQGPFNGIANVYPQIVSAIASAERLIQLENIELEEKVISAPHQQFSGIVFDNVNFSYEPEKNNLKNVSFKISPGDIVGLVGSSGSGKTTVIRLILSFINSNSGNIYFTNSLNEKIIVSPSCRSLVSYVPQGNTLFSGTIASNLRIGNPNASDEEIISAAHIACAWEFIEKLPDGLNTAIGEKGLGLSEGQAQRLAIARAILHKSPILILDEATSALDSTTEKRILSSIQGLNPPRTCLIITHRRAALKICTKVLKLEEGMLYKS